MAKKKEVGPIRLDLACGANKREGFIGVDLYKTDAVNIQHDLKKYPWPFKNESVDEVVCSHYLEHLTGEERIPFFNELFRILKFGAKATIITPYWTSERAYQDPTHKWPPVVSNFYYYLWKQWREVNKLDHYLGLTCDFDFTCAYVISDPKWASRNDELKTMAIKNYLNVVDDLHMVVHKTKREN